MHEPGRGAIFMAEISGGGSRRKAKLRHPLGGVLRIADDSA